MRLKDYMFKKRYFGDIFLLSVDKDKLIKTLRDNNRYIVLQQENNDLIVVYDILQNYDIDFIGEVYSRGNETVVKGYFSHKVSLIEWIVYFFCIAVFWIFVFRNFTFSIANILWFAIAFLLTLVCFFLMPYISFFIRFT